MNTIELAKGKWFHILSKLGVCESFLDNKAGPCPLCGGKDRFRWDDYEDNGNYFCNQCGSGNGFKLLIELHNWTFREAAAEVDKIVNGYTDIQAPNKKPIDFEKRKESIDKIIQSSKLSIPGDPVFEYLTNRGLSDIPRSIGYCKKLFDFESKKTYHGMVNRIIAPNDSVVSLQRTFIKDGMKAEIDSPRKIMPTLGTINGAAIRLFTIPADGIIGVAEGVETAIAVKEIFNVSCWSVMSANGIKTFQPPKEVKEVIIFGDNDKNFIGQGASYTLAKTLIAQGIISSVEIPPRVGNDWLDELIFKNSLNNKPQAER